ncbi:MAG: hypothetical protein LUE92_03135, partial [Clostridiales bacterium]|nr:hypothetical protein [Clostridiales bacterium]
FVNIMLQNARLFQNNINTDIAGDLSPANQVSESISAIIDINDRYGYNTCRDYKSDSSQLEHILDEMAVVMNNKLKGLLEKGEY